MAKKKKLSNLFSTGGGGIHFEAHVQASFVALMLTGGHAPCLPCWPIVEIKLQGKIDGFDTDDLVVVVENVNSKERRKLRGQAQSRFSLRRKKPYPYTEGETTDGRISDNRGENGNRSPRRISGIQDFTPTIIGKKKTGTIKTAAKNISTTKAVGKNVKTDLHFIKNML